MYVFFLNKFTLNTCHVFEFGLLINGYLLLFYCQNYTDNVMTCPTSFGPDHPVVYKELQKSVGRHVPSFMASFFSCSGAIANFSSTRSRNKRLLAL